MRKIVVVLGVALTVAITVRAQQPAAPAAPAAPTFPGQAFKPGPHEWAFPVITFIAPPETGEHTVPGST
jgi:hypothetical protein